ncbi:hypothetical protein ACFCWL_40315, partial [Streptomyces sp. NPDC056387]
TAGDFNGDGKQDIAGIDATDNLKLYTGDGAGNLGGGTDMLGSNGLWKASGPCCPPTSTATTSGTSPASTRTTT